MRTLLGVAATLAALTALTLAVAGGAGCGGVYYTAEVYGASSRLEYARVLGAETLAPYEYYYAKEHLTQAQIESSHANYSDAAHYAETAEEYADKAVQLTQAAKRASGR
jgi:Domain of unknown function (DUF4398)